MQYDTIQIAIRVLKYLFKYYLFIYIKSNLIDYRCSSPLSPDRHFTELTFSQTTQSSKQTLRYPSNSFKLRVYPSIVAENTDHTIDMGAIDELGLKPGVITGDDVLHVIFLQSELLMD